MHHLCRDDTEERWVFFWIRNFCTNEIINFVHMQCFFQPNQDMSMRKTLFLSFYGVHVTTNITKNLSLNDKAHERFLLLVKDSCSQIMVILRFLSFKKLLLYLCSFWITRKSNEEVWSSIISDIGHGVLCAFMHVCRYPSKA